jgi:hypothetical protein
MSTRPSLSFHNGSCAPVVRNYAEFGFADGRTGNPNQAWEALRALAEQRGFIRDGTMERQ